MTPQRGRHIAFEGGEGSGKTTQAAIFAQRLGALLTREPGGTELGRQMRALLLAPPGGPIAIGARAEALLLAADRAQHFSEVVAPSLESGHDVVSDRSAFSFLAYQGYGRGFDLDDLTWVSTWATEGIWPDFVVLIDLPLDVAQRRLSSEGGVPDRIEAAGPDFHARVRDGFRALAASDPDRWVAVDGQGSPADVASRVFAAWQRWLEI